MNKALKNVLGAAALGLACHAPATLAAYATAVVDASLTVTGGAGYQLLAFTVTPSAATAAVGDALADADGDVLSLADGVFVTGTVFADALFPPASEASANYSSVQPLFVLNTSGATNTLDFSFDFSYVIEALNDLLAPIELANSTVTVSLQQIANGVTTELFAETALATIASGVLVDAGNSTNSFVFSRQLAAGEVTSFLVGVNATSHAATAVPLPASVLLLAPALGMLALRRRVAA